MKKFKVVLILLSVFVTTTYGQTANRIEVLNFHSTHRCVKCKAIEKNTKETLNTAFANELKEGIISWQVVNVDKKENYEIAEKFEATGTSMFLNVVINGKEERIDITRFAFSNAKNPSQFATILKSKIEDQLKKV
jgi:glutaredoxin